MHLELAIFLQFFLGLVAAVNPVGIMPVFVSLTSHMTVEEKNKTAATANIAVAVILITALLGGQVLLDMFSISLDSFRVAGGLLLLSIAFSMMSGKLGEDKQNKQEKSEHISREQIGIVPIAMPLMAGPGAISSTIVYSARYPGMLDTFGIALTIAVFSISSWLLFRSAPYIVRILGQTGINVITRIMGLILGALGIEFIANGLRSLFPGLA
ncbi:YchE family NAAT transporter [Vibrio cincinnatiensis]|uniref:YchE family NAAT transporter n=1 Tax=Vibrio cincinnatiensis TaxID=675 RepID=UPI0012ACC5EA|nr:YchE family NAAT transporter [Vibrio cincinnatiensis]MCG3722881.1 YchE family NAAT transporter [Vibrio cincinnatiensis]MCG3724683.1 YchE family NAAT transporter [Vibrio cincinnatiensis]MCG3731672.1 YchE family NAAT transporter [Vibrio cincinnatiensis]MCG3736939.1 YchE family NAAT transporter [Vibrio cincinnatiensis]MCG3738344.1 YchE family NAAT transporter [Vibrio cincinnatiensis]